MRDQWAVTQKRQQLVCFFRKNRFIRQKAVGKPVHLLSGSGHWAKWIEICVIVIAGHDPADHFNAADFDHAIPGCGVKSSRFGIEYNFTHSMMRCEPLCSLMQDPRAAF